MVSEEVVASHLAIIFRHYDKDAIGRNFGDTLSWLQFIADRFTHPGVMREPREEEAGRYWAMLSWTLECMENGQLHARPGEFSTLKKLWWCMLVGALAKHMLYVFTTGPPYEEGQPTIEDWRAWFEWLWLGGPQPPAHAYFCPEGLTHRDWWGLAHTDSVEWASLRARILEGYLELEGIPPREQ